MIVCHCQNITDRDINNAIDWMRASDARTVITCLLYTSDAADE